MAILIDSGLKLLLLLFIILSSYNWKWLVPRNNLIFLSLKAVSLKHCSRSTFFFFLYNLIFLCMQDVCASLAVSHPCYTRCPAQNTVKVQVAMFYVSLKSL